MWHTKQLIFHGAVVLLVGLLCGVPMGRSIVRGRAESVVRAWRVAHSSLVLGGVLLLALGGVVTYLSLSPPALAMLVWAFIASSYAFSIVLPLGAHYGYRGLISEPPLFNRVVHFGNLLGVVGFLVGTLLLLWGAYAAL